MAPSPSVKKVLVDAPHYSLKEQTKFLRILNKEKLDLMHFTHFNAPVCYFKPSVLTIHDLTLSFFPGRKHRSFLMRAAYQFVLNSSVKKAKNIIAVSENTKRDLIKQLHVKPEKISVIYEGVNDEFEKVQSKELINLTLQKYNIEQPYILYTGVWRSHKNLVGLIKAFKTLKEKYHLKAQLVITGREDPYYPEVKEHAKSSGHENDIKFTGLVSEEDLIALYSGSKCVVLPSFYEGFGFTPLEGMKCGIPVAVSKTSCLPEICGKDNALFFDPYDVNDMTSQIHRLFIDEKLREKLIKNGKNRVKDFSWETLAKQTLAVYNKTLA